ncbi:MAG: Serine/threonine exchanger SteT [Chroococcidiopsis cubana SAG 39.79]|jgi:basic amino acid/polyamine antiporter, APA family|uniref:Amino acid/polyamine/organocation transporter, APC superfamily n=2 Tax=Chroococcidiopsis TaxID=54298 RepID=K9TV63_CHRTP|nr:MULTISPECIES: amino acid permease [Chroococcidiopsis]PSB42168.1 amino acid permease [Cyanosarcina cf. burmensis CCALA 770]AFY86071.1 amino acid/polyamine/organocation transporter, APC superfamily [Chroococcidiopsis thermalis PCC 7203]MDZ4873298.1 Serine/threonine exchanger SteT [Chroococcidiopsis cubana SAG 39.79]PSB63735.1 amino acid permease [Chroococcidiopsis cubana CCALA 043]RUT08015.1 amino acid transporter [Chroococcidiopsis cubana SAG 39.79]
MANKVASPALKPTLSVVDASAIVVGMVIGAGIFETPTLVAQNAGSQSVILFAWLLGGVASLIGALCYAELTTAYPHPGGDYHYFMRAFGTNVAFLFAWARMTVIQTGSITLFAYAFGDYASQILPLGSYSSAIYAALCIAILTGLHIMGVQQGKWTQNLLTLSTVLGLALVIIAGMITVAGTTPVPNGTPTNNGGAFGLAMVFVLLTYGGWNEAAYISAEVRDARHNMVKTLLLSIALIAGLYMLVNFAYIHGLGIAGVANSKAVAADLMRRVFGESGARLISFIVAVTALSSINATIFTGARTNFALGQDFRSFSLLGQWSDRRHTPTNALLIQGAIALGLVLLGTITHEGEKGFETMTAYTSPVFWCFFLLSGIALFVLRQREPNTPRTFQVPGYPITPLIFCAICAYLLYSSITYASSQAYSIGAIVGISMMVVGVPVLFWVRRRH